MITLSAVIGIVKYAGKREDEDMNHVIVEWAPFELSEGVDESVLLEASAELQREFLSHQTGFIRRELLKKDEGQFVDIVWWKSLEDAERAMKNASESASCGKYFQLMAAAEHIDPGAGVAHFTSLKTYE